MIFATIQVILLSVAMTIWMKAGVTWEALAQVAAAVVGVGAAMGVAGIPVIAAAINLGAEAMMMATIPIIILSIAMTIWMKAGITWEALGQVAAVVVGLGAAMGVAGIPPLNLAIMSGALAMSAAAGALFLMTS